MCVDTSKELVAYSLVVGTGTTAGIVTLVVGEMVMQEVIVGTTIEDIFTPVVVVIT